MPRSKLIHAGEDVLCRKTSFVPNANNMLIFLLVVRPRDLIHTRDDFPSVVLGFQPIPEWIGGVEVTRRTNHRR